LTVNVDAVTEVVATGSEKVAVTVVVRATPVAPCAGTTLTTAGGVRSPLGPPPSPPQAELIAAASMRVASELDECRMC
jgi:hypothetical protein